MKHYALLEKQLQPYRKQAVWTSNMSPQNSTIRVPALGDRGHTLLPLSFSLSLFQYCLSGLTKLLWADRSTLFLHHLYEKLIF